ncbi:HrpE/YscL family type III secretion apparatus protein [Agarilytica rhodophyticola]|uniref:HrpE/YscL family type III secretion apparatus protein n=1 Tax=Agarilytica rhodophyticola TaxID=1737490 RepID=UPI000B343EE0|nr:HrpE/YscL family type III secretion apparatus protein [Agarilytica rhodophyticola]
MTVESTAIFDKQPHVENQLKSFVKKKISFAALNRDPNGRRGDVVRANEITKVMGIDQYISKATSVIGKIVKREQHKTRKYESKIQEDIKTHAWQQVLTEIKNYQDKQDEYFDLIELHCSDIVKSAISTIVADFDDDLKISSTIEALISKTKNENNAIIVVSPEHEELATKYAIDNDWSVETSSKLSSSECELRVKNGAYQSQFSGCIEALYSVLDKEKQSYKNDSSLIF